MEASLRHERQNFLSKFQTRTTREGLYILTCRSCITISLQVLGIPDGNVYQKLEKDPMMRCRHFKHISFSKIFFSRKTFSLGSQEDFNLKNGFNKTDMKFTFFVPSDQAWDHIKKQHATAYKVMTLSSLSFLSHCCRSCSWEISTTKFTTSSRDI